MNKSVDWSKHTNKNQNKSILAYGSYEINKSKNQFPNFSEDHIENSLPYMKRSMSPKLNKNKSNTKIKILASPIKKKRKFFPL